MGTYEKLILFFLKDKFQFLELFGSRLHGFQNQVYQKSIQNLQNMSDNESLFLEIDLKKSLAKSKDLYLNLEIKESSKQMFLTGEWDATAALLENEPLIERKSRQLPYIKFGFNDFIIAAGYKSYIVKRYFKNFKKQGEEFKSKINGKNCKG